MQAKDLPRTKTLTILNEHFVVPTVHASTIDEYLEIAEALIEGGIPVIEVCFRDNPSIPPKVTLDAVYALRERFEDALLVGCGTVQSAHRVHSAIEHGAQFIVSNLTDQAMIEAANDNCVLIIPGTRDDSQVQTSRRLGCQVAKVILPASGTESQLFYFFKNFVTLFPGMGFAPSMGITLENVRKFYKSGALFVATSRVIPDGAVSSEEWQQIVDETRKYVEAVHEARQSSK